MINRFFVKVLLAQIIIFSVSAKTQATDCKLIAMPDKRLSCYDEAFKQINPNYSYQNMTLTDFKTDKVQLRGKPVETSGFITAFSDNAILMSEIGDLNPILVDVSKAPREDRRNLASCTNACPVSVKGVGAKVMMQDGIRADRLEFR